MDSITEISLTKKSCCKSSEFHSFVPGLIKFNTLIFSRPDGACEDTKGRNSEGSHRSLHTLILTPSPTLYLKPSINISVPFNKLLQAYDPVCDCGTSKIVPLGKNLGLKTLYSSEFSFWRSLHACFTKRASLNNARPLNPIPPSPLGLHSSSHLTQWIFCLSPL